MSAHRNDTDINELKNYFNSVIDWVSTVFIDVTPDMKGLEWGRLFERYHRNSYNPAAVSDVVRLLIASEEVTNRKGIFEFVLGGQEDTKLLNVRVFDEKIKKAAYMKQTLEAQALGVSNCPHCAIGHDSNKTRVYKPSEMDADHVSAWSFGGRSNRENCQMLCTTHNRAKGNR